MGVAPFVFCENVKHPVSVAPTGIGFMGLLPFVQLRLLDIFILTLEVLTLDIMVGKFDEFTVSKLLSVAIKPGAAPTTHRVNAIPINWLSSSISNLKYSSYFINFIWVNNLY